MKILLTGSTGYIGKRLLYTLLNDGHHVVCCARDKNRLEIAEKFSEQVTIIEVDLLEPESLASIPENIDVAYYLVHSMSSSKNYEVLEEESAKNFKQALEKTTVKQVIFLSGIINDDNLSKHLKSRKHVEALLKSDHYKTTTLRAGIIIGSGSASFEIIRDLVEKLPVMITPKWLNTKCQPIGITDVILLLNRSILNEKTYNKSFDIGGPDILSYKEMLLEFAKVRSLKRYIITVPIMTPKLSSYWLYFVTSTSFRLASALVKSMNVEVICRNETLNSVLEIKTKSYRESLEKAFERIESNDVISSWKDAFISGSLDINITDFINVPSFGCYTDKRERAIVNKENCLDMIWAIGGKNGWYYANSLWQLRGFLDKLFGGVGLRRGRTNKEALHPGDTLDFWRVLYANKSEGRLLLFAEMKLPGDAWLEFKITDNVLYQTATYRPRGILGRLYWLSVLPFHNIIFNGMIKKLTTGSIK